MDRQRRSIGSRQRGIRWATGRDVICDGGVRRVSDIAKALAVGATACSIGRSYLYGLARQALPLWFSSQDPRPRI